MGHRSFVPPELIQSTPHRSPRFGSGHPWGGRVLELEDLNASDDPQRHIRVALGGPNTPTLMVLRMQR